jgi:hypothetical protein
MSLNPKSPVEVLTEKIPTVFKNRYIACLIPFMIWITFFDKANIIEQIKLRSKVEKYQELRQYYVNLIEEGKKNRAALNADLEKFAREEYYLKKNNEDVFIFEEN